MSIDDNLFSKPVTRNLKPSAYTIMDIPVHVHQMWKLGALLRGMNMREYALLCIEAQGKIDARRHAERAQAEYEDGIFDKTTIDD